MPANLSPYLFPSVKAETGDKGRRAKAHRGRSAPKRRSTSARGRAERRAGGEGWRSDGAAARHRRWRDGAAEQDQAGRRSPTTTTAGSEVGPPPQRVQRRPQAAQLDRRGRGGVRPPDVPQWCSGMAPPDLLRSRGFARKGSKNRAGGVDGGTLPDALAGTTRTAVLAADPGDDRRGESLCCWLTTTAARIRGIRDAS